MIGKSRSKKVAEGILTSMRLNWSNCMSLLISNINYLTGTNNSSQYNLCNYNFLLMGN